MRIKVENGISFYVIDLHHLNVRVRAGVGASFTTDAGVVINNHGPIGNDPGDGACGTADHAHRVRAVHAGIGHHPVFKCLAVADKARVSVMGDRAGVDAIIATDTAVKIDQHGLRSVDESFFNCPL